MDRETGHLPFNPSDAVDKLSWIKVVGLGHNGVGKTCLIKHFCEGKYSSGYQPTVGVDYGFKIQEIHDKDVRVHLWDLSGGAEYSEVRNELYGSTDAVFLVYDVTNAASFEMLDMWTKELFKYSNPKSRISLVANKVDLHCKRLISTTQGKKLAIAKKWRYHETSCVTGDGVNQVFIDLLEDVMKNRKVSEA